MSTLIFTGRFQPLHNKHIELLEEIKRIHPNELLIICIIRNSIDNTVANDNNSFNKESIKKQTKENNPIPNWNRYMLIKLAIESNPILRNNTIVMFRDRSDLDWEKSLQDLPDDRVWIFPKIHREKFDIEKYNFYLSKNEKIETINVKKDNDISATQIRNNLKQGNYDLSFLPNNCQTYFKNECLKYFL